MSTPVEQIKDRLDIVEVLGSYIKLEKAGINWKARCPFHNEKTPSFMVSPARQSFYCFGCSEKGDIFTFVEKFEGLDFKGALKTLADRAGVTLDSRAFSNEETENERRKERLLNALEAACGIFEDNLKNSKSSIEYISDRGIEDSKNKWRLGFARDEWRQLHDALMSHGFSREEMIAAGLIKKTDGEEKYYDTFRNRITFPICDSIGRVIAFSGRTLSSESDTPKYLNSPETLLFHKASVLHGWHLAKEAMRKLDFAVLVEGQIDLVMSHQAGVLNTVATSGTAVSEEHLQKIKKLSNRIIIAYDADEAGHKASLRAADIAIRLGMEVKLAEIPEGEDPASIIKHDPEQWKNILRNSEHVIDALIIKLKKENKGNSLLKSIQKNVLPLLALIKSDMEKAHLAEKISRLLGVSQEAVLKDTSKIITDQSVFIETNKNTHTLTPDRMIAGIIFSNQFPEARERLEARIGKEEVVKIIENNDNEKEKVLFELELHSAGRSIEAVANDLLGRLEVESLKEKLKKKTAELDTATESQSISLRKEIAEISTQLTNL